MRFDIISLFPEFVAQIAAHGVVGRAGQRGLLSIHGWNPRDHAEGSYRRVDDRPFGGGPGMVMLLDPLRAAIQAARAAGPEPVKVIYLSPQGTRLTQAKVRELAVLPRLVLLCGRYEGVDERLVQGEVDEELSIGDYVLSGGELAAAVLIDAVARLQDGALNDAESAVQDSFEGDGLLDCPHYTRPVEHGLGLVPEVLLIPLNAFDDRGYRIGYGGGYFDRTLAAIQTVAVGVGFEIGRVADTFAQPHDRPMQWLATEAGVMKPLC